MLAHVPGPEIEADAPLQMLVTTLDWSDYVGRIGVGRIHSGSIRQGQRVALMQAESVVTPGKVTQLFSFDNLGRTQVEQATAGDLCAVVGLESISIGDTVSDFEVRRALPRIQVNEPTLEMTFGINTSPLSGAKAAT